MKQAFEVGSMWVHGDRLVQMDGMDSLVAARVRDVVNGEIVSVPIAKLKLVPQPERKPGPAYVSEQSWKRCVALAKDFQAIPDGAPLSKEDAATLARRHQLSVRQIQRKRKQFLKNPVASELQNDRAGRRSGTKMLSDLTERVIQHVIEKHYLCRERVSKEYIADLARSLARRVKATPPSRNAVMRRIAMTDGWKGDIKRQGSKAAAQKWEPRVGGNRGLMPLDLVQIDHTRVDLMVVSEDRQKVLGRPWISLAIDVATRVVLGMYLSMDAPSSLSVCLTIEHAVLPKPPFEGTDAAWQVYGKPKCILVDNGKDFRSEALKRGCEEHGIELQWRPVRTPHYGGHIERLNGTLMQLCHMLPGTTFSNPKERGDYDSAAHATMTLGELRAWLQEKICRYYHVRRHRSLGQAPILAWEQGWTDATGTLQSPTMVARPDAFKLDFLPFVSRQVSRVGIMVAQSRYWHADLHALVRIEEKVLVRFDPRDRSHVWVQVPGHSWIRAAAMSGPAVGDPRRYIPHRPHDQARLDRDTDAHFERCDEIEKKAAQATRKARRSPKPSGARVMPTLSAQSPGKTAGNTHLGIPILGWDSTGSSVVQRVDHQPTEPPQGEPMKETTESNPMAGGATAADIAVEQTTVPKKLRAAKPAAAAVAVTKPEPSPEAPEHPLDAPFSERAPVGRLQIAPAMGAEKPVDHTIDIAEPSKPASQCPVQDPIPAPRPETLPMPWPVVETLEEPELETLPDFEPLPIEIWN